MLNNDVKMRMKKCVVNVMELRYTSFVWIYGNNMCISMRIYYCIVVGGETQISTLSLMNTCSSIDIYVDTSIK